MAKSRRVSPPAGTCALRGSLQPRRDAPAAAAAVAAWPHARGGDGGFGTRPLPRTGADRPDLHPEIGEEDALTPIEQAQHALLRLQSARDAGAPRAAALAFTHELDASMRRVAQLTSTIAVLDGLRGLLQSGCQ